MQAKPGRGGTSRGQEHHKITNEGEDNMPKYRGIVSDRMGTIEDRKTKFYDTYKEAHEAAEKLCKKTIGERGKINVYVTSTKERI